MMKTSVKGNLATPSKMSCIFTLCTVSAAPRIYLDNTLAKRKKGKMRKLAAETPGQAKTGNYSDAHDQESGGHWRTCGARALAVSICCFAVPSRMDYCLGILQVNNENNGCL